MPPGPTMNEDSPVGEPQNDGFASSLDLSGSAQQVSQPGSRTSGRPSGAAETPPHTTQHPAEGGGVPPSMAGMFADVRFCRLCVLLILGYEAGSAYGLV